MPLCRVTVFKFRKNFSDYACCRWLSQSQVALILGINADRQQLTISNFLLPEAYLKPSRTSMMELF